MKNISTTLIVIRGAGDLASGMALRLYGAGLRRLLFLETAQPMAVRRTVSFCEAVYQGHCEVEGVRAELIHSPAEAEAVWSRQALPVLVDPEAACVPLLCPEVLIEATLAKRNVGVRLGDAPLVIGLGPGFSVGVNVHRIVETNRGINLGRLLREGSAAPNNGVPGTVMGYTTERVLRAPQAGLFTTSHDIGDPIQAGASVGEVDGNPVLSQISGTVRGLLRSHVPVSKALKVGDIEPRPNIDLYRVSDKSLAMGGAVLEAILEHACSQH